ncbi:MAG: GatB/YqeY domain-containing protein [Clostridia bacterium]|nr:GatB/YqeY domain-containing protein [Clostridia bacterium]
MDLAFFKKEKITAMKEKNRAAVSALEVVITKIMTATIDKRAKGEELSEADINTIIQKAEKELIEEREGYAKAGRTENVEALNAQLEVLKKYLPKLLSEEEVRAIILSLEDKSVPSVMKHFKANYAGKVDMKMVNTILRNL